MELPPFESSGSVNENPYGYKFKEINAPGKDVSLAFCGVHADHLVDLTGARSSLATQYKNNEVKLQIHSESIFMDVKLSFLQEYENAWFFKPEVVKHQGLILLVGSFDENELGGVFDTNFLYSIKVNNSMRYMLLEMQYDAMAERVPDDILNAVGKWIGSVSNASMVWTVPLTDVQKRYMSVIVTKKLANALAKEFIIPEYKKLRQKHQYLADARWGSLKKFLSYRKMDPIQTTDPLGNTIAHLSIFNQFLDVFMTIAKTHPKLINIQNIFGNTSLHNVGLLHLRKKDPSYFNWNLFWELPWDFSIKNKKNETGIEKLCQMPATEIFAAFQALVANVDAWSQVTKCHDVSKLLSQAVIGYLSYYTDKTVTKSEADSLHAVQFFVETGANDKDAMLTAALSNHQASVANYLSQLVTGANITFAHVTTAFQSLHRPTADVVLKRFNFSSITLAEINLLCSDAVIAGWTDVVRFLAKKGGKFPLELISKGKPILLSMANLIAQLNSTTILPLKYLCIDAIECMERTDFMQIFAAMPEEIRLLFPNKELWRWTLFLDNECKRNRFLQLYRAIHRAQCSQYYKEQKERAMQICIGQVEFEVHREVHYSTGGLTIYLGKQFYRLVCWHPRLSTVYKVLPTKAGEENAQLLDNLLQLLGWPLEDAYVFLMICYNALLEPNAKSMTDQVLKLKAHHFFFPETVHTNMAPPDWYKTFVKEFYGLDPPKHHLY